jgi:hypothetical protein
MDFVWGPYKKCMGPIHFCMAAHTFSMVGCHGPGVRGWGQLVLAATSALPPRTHYLGPTETEVGTSADPTPPCILYGAHTFFVWAHTFLYGPKFCMVGLLLFVFGPSYFIFRTYPIYAKFR